MESRIFVCKNIQRRKYLPGIAFPFFLPIAELFAKKLLVRCKNCCVLVVRVIYHTEGVMFSCFVIELQMFLYSFKRKNVDIFCSMIPACCHCSLVLCLICLMFPCSLFNFGHVPLFPGTPIWPSVAFCWLNEIALVNFTRKYDDDDWDHLNPWVNLRSP